MLNIGVTGHREIRDPERISQAVDNVLEHIMVIYEASRLQVVSPLAEGADRILVWRALQKFPLHLIVPLPLEIDDYLLEFKSAASRAAFKTLLEKADQIIHLPLRDTREECYLAAGRYVLDHSKVLVALWDGEPARGIGGTAQIVCEARERGMPLAWIQVSRWDGGPSMCEAGAAAAVPVSYENFPFQHKNKVGDP
jgi:hypothetical protein